MKSYSNYGQKQFLFVIAAINIEFQCSYGTLFEQEQTKLYDLRRGIKEDFQRLAKFQRTLSKSTKKIHQF